MACAWCGKADAARKCRKCKASYCGSECQRADWKEGGHKERCSAPVCYICYDEDDPEKPLPLGCACTRGRDGYVHPTCAIRAATESAKVQHSSIPWVECPVCKHQYNGDLRVIMTGTLQETSSDNLGWAKTRIMMHIHASEEAQASELARLYEHKCSLFFGANSTQKLTFAILDIQAGMCNARSSSAYSKTAARLEKYLEQIEKVEPPRPTLAARAKLLLAQTQLHLLKGDYDTVKLIESTLPSTNPADELHWGIKMFAATTRILYGSRDLGLSQLEEMMRESKRVFGIDHPMHKSAAQNLEIAKTGIGCVVMARKSYPFIVRI